MKAIISVPHSELSNLIKLLKDNDAEIHIVIHVDVKPEPEIEPEYESEDEYEYEYQAKRVRCYDDEDELLPSNKRFCFYPSN